MDENNYLDMDSVGSGDGRKGPEKDRRSFFYGGLVVGMAVSLLIVCGVYLGTRLQNFAENKRVQQEEAQLGREAEAEGSVLTPDVMEKIRTVEKVINQYYYKNDIDKEAMEEGVYRGMLYSTEDPYTEYYSQKELEELYQQTEGTYYGIGAYVSLDETTGLPKISGVFDGAPAQEAGLRTDDLIYEVDGTSVSGETVSQVVTRIKGEEGTYTKLTIIREGEDDFLDVNVQRRKVVSPTVEFEMKENDIAYIMVREFDEVTIDQFAEALAMGKGSGMKGLIIDVRSNPGGNLDTVVEMCRMLLPEGLIVYTEDKYGERIEYSGDGSRQIKVPMVMLVNGNSASASEILAGAVKDYGVGTLVGTTTFGKGIVQRVIPLEDGSAIKLTTSSYFTPKGNNIHGIGIEPDIVCEFDAELYYGAEKRDNQLEKAMEVLLDKIGSTK